MTDRDSEFINYKNDVLVDSDTSLARVRSHVMKKYLRKQNAYNAGSSEEKHFRYYANTGRSLLQQHLCTCKQELRKSSQSRALNTSGTEVLPLWNSKCRSCAEILRIELYNKAQQKALADVLNHSLLRELGHPSLDPLDVLPIAGSAETEDLIRWYFVKTAPKADRTIPWLQQLNSSWQMSLWNMAKQDAGILHNLLSIAELRKQSSTGKMNNKIYYHHLGQAIQAIQDSILEITKNGVSEAFIMLISNQVTLSLAEMDYPQARIHMRALRDAYMGDPRWTSCEDPQPQFLSINCIPFVHLMLSNFRLASVECMDPILPPPEFKVVAFVPSQILETARTRTLKIMPHFPPGLAHDSAYNLTYELHQTSFVLDEEYSQELSVQYMMDVTMRTVSHLCRLVASSKRAMDQRINEPLRPVDAFIFCMQTFCRDCMPREVPMKNRQSIDGNIRSVLTTHIYHGLSRAVDLSTYWRDAGASLQSLLWVLFEGVSTSRALGLDTLSWYQDELKVVMKHLELESLAALERVLKLFPWSAGQFGVSFLQSGIHLGMSDAVLPSRMTFRAEASID